MSKTRLFDSIRSLNLDAVASLLQAHPELKRVKDERGRNLLHLSCSRASHEKTSRRSLELAQYLLDLGFGINEPAFVEGAAFKATPLWYAISRGGNLPLAKFLLKKGSSPEYCLWSACFHDDVEAVDLLVKHGASLDPVAEDETPFLGAIKWSHFASAERLLHHGANLNFQNSKGMREMDGEHQDVGQALVALALEVVLGQPEGAVPVLVHAAGDGLGLREDRDQVLVRVAALVGGGGHLPHVGKIDVAGVDGRELGDHDGILSLCPIAART
jgi:ankyrin repeat protein